MANGDPDCELIDNEIDWARLIKIILLELRAQKPLPNVDSYWRCKGFDLKKRPMSLTLQMLHNFIVVVTEDSNERYVEVDKEVYTKEVDKKREESTIYKNTIYVEQFEALWKRYPRGIGKKDALRHFKVSVTTEEDVRLINQAMDNYLKHLKTTKTEPKYMQYGSTWFNNWRDWVNYEEPSKPHKEPSLGWHEGNKL